MTFFYLLVILAAFYLFLVAEFFLPSGGMLGVAAVATLIAAIVIAFSHSVLTGAAVIGFVLLTTPLVLMGMASHADWPPDAESSTRSRGAGGSPSHDRARSSLR